MSYDEEKVLPIGADARVMAQHHAIHMMADICALAHDKILNPIEKAKAQTRLFRWARCRGIITNPDAVRIVEMFTLPGADTAGIEEREREHLQNAGGLL